MGVAAVGGLFCSRVLTKVEVETLSKQGFEGLCEGSGYEGTRRPARDRGVVICTAFAKQAILSVVAYTAFSELTAAGTWRWQRFLSAVWRMTLVAMALQGCGGAGREGVLSVEGARLG